jgi:hypothetical protein
VLIGQAARDAFRACDQEQVRHAIRATFIEILEEGVRPKWALAMEKGSPTNDA